MKAPFRVDYVNIKLKEAPFKSPQDEEREALSRQELEDPAMTQREVTSPYIVPSAVVSDGQYQYLNEAANDYFRQVGGNSCLLQHSIDREAKQSLKEQNKSGDFPSDGGNYKSPHNKPLIDEDASMTALLLSGHSPKASRRKLRPEGQMVTGVIEELDRKMGLVRLRVDGDFLELYFLPPSIQDLLVKDTITVKVRPL